MSKLVAKCELANGQCNQKEKDCNKCISQEMAWQKINCYMECHNYDISYEFLKNYFVSYYLKKLYCNPIMLDIIENNKEECRLLFE